MIIVRSTEIALKLIREMEGESHLVEDEPYLIEEDRAHHELIIIEGSANRYVIHPVSGEIGIYLGHSSTKAIEKWTAAGGRDWDTICEKTSVLPRSESAQKDIKKDVIVHLLRTIASTGLQPYDKYKKDVRHAGRRDVG
jgi:hypothetical protein